MFVYVSIAYCLLGDEEETDEREHFLSIECRRRFC